MTKPLGCQSNNHSDCLLEDIKRATVLVYQLLGGQISYEQFLKYYDSFYYKLGIEELAEPYIDCLQKYHAILSIHRLIQEEVFDRIYVGGFVPPEVLHQTNRMFLDEGMIRLRQLVEKYKETFLKYLDCVV